MKNEIYDVLIIGAGPAGLTAGIYSARNGLKTGIISKDIGGTANSIMQLENWPGFTGSGAHLMKQMHEHLKKYEVDFIMKDVLGISKKNNEFIVKTKKDEFKSKTLIIATGTERKRLNIPNEEKLIGKGVSYCVTCDGFFFKGKTVGVIGGSDCAAVSALALSDIAKKVYIIYRGEKLRCESFNQERLKQKKNVEIHYNSIPLKILGDEKVEGLEISEDKKKKTLKLDGVFIEIGATPLTDLLKNLDLKLDKEKHIIVNENMESSVSGLFAAGDVTNHKLKQVIVAGGQGAIAAKSAYDYLSKL